MRARPLLWALLAVLPARAPAEIIPVEYQPPADRALAAAWLGKIKARKALPVLLKLCDDPDGGVRYAAVEALGLLGDPAAVATLERIAADPKATAVPGVITFDGSFYDNGKRPREHRYDVRAAARRALVNIPTADGPREATHAIAHLQALDRAAVRRYWRGDHQYRQSPQGERDGRVYTDAWESIRVVSGAPGPKGTATLLAVLGCGNENLELQAAYGLVQRPTAQVLPGVRRVLAGKDLSPMTLTACLHVVLAHDPEGARPLARRLVERLKTADDFERFPHREQSYLEQTLTAKDVPLLEDLRAARKGFLGPAAVDRLIARLKREEGAVDFLETDPIPPRLREEAVRVLLRELNKDERDWKTFKASYQLGRLKAREAVPGLLRFLQYDGQGSYTVYKDTASYYQSMAGWALTQIADPASVPQVRRIALDARQPFTARSAAILAYGRLAGPTSAADLARVLDEEDAQFESVAGASPVGDERGARLAFPSFNSCREAAAWALADVGDKVGRAALARYLDSGKKVSGDIATAVHRVDARAIDAWSQQRVRSTNEEERKLAVTVRYTFFPQSAGPVARTILAAEQDPLWEATVKFLGRVALADAEMTRALVVLVANDPGKPNCNRRLKLIDALGRQGPSAAAALAEFAEHGRIAR